MSVALLYLGSACMQDPEAPHNQPDTPSLSVDETSVTRVSMLVNGSFGHDLTDITSYGVELSTTLFESGGEVQTLTPQEVGPDGYALGISGLSPNETYYLRAFISNGHSKMYSSVITQKTPETSVASVSDVSISADGTYMTATLEDDGGRSVEEVGFVWGEQNDRRAIRREKRYPATLSDDGKSFKLPVSYIGKGTHYVLAYAEDNKEATGFSRIALERIVRDDEPLPEFQPANEIWYTSTDGEVIQPSYPESLDATITSNTYEDGKGIIQFDQDLKSIGNFAFTGCTRLASIQLPGALESIGRGAISAAAITTVHIPQSVTSLGNECFSNCWGLASFTGKYASEDSKALIIDGTMVAFAPAGRPTEYTIDASVKVLDGAFTDCGFLEKLNLPDGLERINENTFHQCWGLTEFEFPSSLKYIKESAFPRCENLTKLVFPQSSFTVECDAFHQCPKLSSLSGNYVNQDGRSMIIDNTLVCVALAGLGEYTVPEGITSTCTIHGYNDGLHDLKKLVYPESITQIGQIWNCESLESITVKAATPPSFKLIMLRGDNTSNELYNVNNCLIYVPAESVDAYKSAQYWSDYADRIQPIPGDISPNKYLTFTSEGTTKLSLSNQGYAPVLYYSFDTTSWTQWDYGELSFAADKPLYICGDNANGLCPDSNVYTVNVFTASGDLFAVSGDIMSLLNKDEDMTAIPGNPGSSAIISCFYGLFRDCTILTSGPSLPALQLTPLCYSYMFSGCTALKVAPELPATIISSRCYDHMFEGCSALTEAPALSANSLAGGCYANMFQDCTGLSSAPELPATTLTGYCYDNMFQGCTRLTAAPVLPATAIDMYSYRGMFSGCTSLVTPPELPATTFKSFECYEEMFKGCTSLATAPALPVTELTYGCYANMFKDCTSLRTAPELPAEVLARNCYYGMFENCSKLTTTPELPATAMESNCYRSMFDSCTSLRVAPSLPATTLSDCCYTEMFAHCSNLEVAPELPATTLAYYCYGGMFWECTSLTTAPELPASTLATSSYSSMFKGCTNLNYVKCLATDVSVYMCINEWLSGVSATGTFVKAANVEWPSGTSGIPEGWAVEEL